MHCLEILFRLNCDRTREEAAMAEWVGEHEIAARIREANPDCFKNEIEIETLYTDEGGEC